MADRIDQLLDQLSPPTEAPPAAPAFLRAVARRRHQRRLTRAAAALSILLIAGLSAAFLLQTPRPHRSGRGPVIADGHATTRPTARPGALTLVSLSRANAGRDVDSLLLPDPSPDGGEAQVPTTLTRDPDLLDQVARQ